MALDRARLRKSAWLYAPAPNPLARARIICFSFAGGGPAIFRTWPAALPQGLEVVGIRLPGRESRWNEAPYADWQRLVAGVVAEVAGLIDLPYVLYGHSFGAMLAYETARALRLLGLQAPQTLVLSACRTPHDEPHARAPWAGSSAELWSWASSMEGTPSAILHDPALRQVFEPALRADLRLAEAWRNDPSVLLESAIVTFGAEADPIVPPYQIEGWPRYTAGTCEHFGFPGGHFFTQEFERDVLARIAAICLGALPLETATC